METINLYDGSKKYLFDNHQENNLYQNQILNVIVNKNATNIEAITYLWAIKNYIAHNKFYYKVNKCYGNNGDYNTLPINEEQIIELGYLLAQFKPNVFFDVYNLTSNKKEKELLEVGLDKLLQNIAMFKDDETCDFIYDKYYHRYNGGNDYEFNIPINTWYSRLTLDDNKKVSEACYQYDGINNTDITFWVPRPYSNLDEKLIDSDTVQFICDTLIKSDYSEYQKLIQEVNHRDPYYDIIMNASSNYYHKVDALKRGLKR